MAIPELQKIIHLFRKKKKKKMPSLWLGILFGTLLFGGGVVFVVFLPFFSPDAEDLLPAEHLILFADFESPSCQNTLGSVFPQWCEQQSQFIEQMTGILPDRAEVFSDEMVIAAYKNPFSEDNPFQFVGLFRVQSREHAETMLQKMGTSAPDVDGTSVFQLEGEQQRIAFLSSGWLIVSDDPSFSHLVHNVRQGNTLSLGKSEEFTSPHFSASGDTLLRGFVTKDLLLPLFPKSVSPQFEHVFRHVSLFSFLVTQSKQNISAYFDIPLPGVQNTFSNTSENNFPSLSQETGAVILANNFGELFQNLTKELEETDPAFSFFLWGRARALAQEWFGKEVDLENDILPLFEKGMAFWYVPEHSFAIAGLGRTEIAPVKEKMLAGLQKKAEYFVPRVLTHTLEDGTQIREIAACDGCVSVSSEEISGGTLDIFSAEDAEGNTRDLSLGHKENLFLVTNNTNLGSDILSYDFSLPHQKKAELFFGEAQNVSLPEGQFFDFFRDITHAEIHVSLQENALRITIQTER